MDERQWEMTAYSLPKKQSIDMTGADQKPPLEERLMAIEERLLIQDEKQQYIIDLLETALKLNYMRSHHH